MANLCAGEGLGNTALVNLLPLQITNNVKFCLLDANHHSDTTTLLAKCLIDLGVDSSRIIGADQPLLVLENRLLQLDKADTKVILVFDNSDLLDTSIFKELSSWLSWQQDSKYLLNAIFASRQPIELFGQAKERLQEIDLPALTESEVADYLLHRLRAVGFQQALPFSEQEINRLYQLSHGNPLQLNQAAHQQLMGLQVANKGSVVKEAVDLLSRWSGIGSLY